MPDRNPLEQQTAMLLGALDQGVRTLTEGQRQLGETMNTRFSERKEALEAHILRDEVFEKEIRQTYLDVLERLTVVERIADTVDGHGRALVDLESRANALESHNEIDAKIRANNAKWLKVIAIMVAMLLGGEGWKLVPELLKHFGG